MKAKKKQKPTPATPEINDNSEKEFIILGHLIKYNLYLLTKSIVFSSICNKIVDSKNVKMEDFIAAVDQTNKIILELDLDTKRRVSDEITKN